jgi:hypothetical protein
MSYAIAAAAMPLPPSFSAAFRQPPAFSLMLASMPRRHFRLFDITLAIILR